MNCKRITSTIFVWTAYVVALIAQETGMGTGLLPDDGTYNTLPTIAVRLTRDFVSLPRRHSLQMYCPFVRSQSHYKTCAAWATVYAARTIAEAVSRGWTSRDYITHEAFAPMFVYPQIKAPETVECNEGSHIFKALEVLKEKGCVKLKQFDVLCAEIVPNTLMNEALQYRIDDYYTLFKLDETSDNEKIIKIRKAISEDHPVVIAMNLPSSFMKWDFKDWSGMDVNPDDHGYHAMCVVGYDDDRNGGSFHLMNSWSRKWGDDGFVWVRYSDFAKYVDQAYEMYVRKQTPEPAPAPIPKPVPKPAPVKRNRLSGEIELLLPGGEKMRTVQKHWTGISYYQCTDTYLKGQKYRLYISTDEPGYLYLIGSDTEQNDALLFPNDGQSPLLAYKSNHIAFPNESTLTQANQRGKEYLCFLYSSKTLDINQILASMRNYEGHFYARVTQAIGGDRIPMDDIKFIQNQIGFSALSDKIVVPVFIEMTIK